ncbi:hypothetical protein [Bacillus marinisedimentorum]|nr:hypothetical protein [Bacillus marinisedimentorum]
MKGMLWREICVRPLETELLRLETVIVRREKAELWRKNKTSSSPTA